MLNRIFAAAALGSMMIAVPAVAGEKLPQATVSYSDLNLNSEAGQAKLEQRIVAAARKVCQADTPSVASKIMSAEKRRCLEVAINSAKPQVASVVQDAALGG